MHRLWRMTASSSDLTGWPWPGWVNPLSKEFRPLCSLDLWFNLVLLLFFRFLRFSVQYAVRCTSCVSTLPTKSSPRAWWRGWRFITHRVWKNTPGTSWFKSWGCKLKHCLPRKWNWVFFLIIYVFVSLWDIDTLKYKEYKTLNIFANAYFTLLVSTAFEICRWRN